ncbi:MAG: uracil phosphoribosyltransferase [Phascolarctobacterium sp.]|nr:uracil phosphoribosyltransferase [Candidatus Phascolarctobacterium caballi]
MQITVCDHPLIKTKLTHLRNEKTGTTNFRRIINEIGALMTYEVLKDLPVRSVKVRTPLEECEGFEEDKTVVVVPILRAGLGFMEGVLMVVPQAHVGHIGMSRNEETLQPEEYYYKMPKDKDAYYVITDPMLATGGSAVAAIDNLKKRGITNIRFMCLVAVPEGIEVVNKAHPDVKLYTCAIDRCLNDKGYILPGLGDAGDRIFGTV